MVSFSLEEWLEQIDPSMKEYAYQLEKFGFGSLKTLRNIDGDDISNYFPEMLPGHKKALLGEARKLITPVKGTDATISKGQDSEVNKKRQRQLDFINNNISTSGPMGNNTGSNISVVVNTSERESGQSETASLAKKSRLDGEPDDPIIPKNISDKEEDLVIKLSKIEAEIETKTEEINCYMIPVETLPTIGKMGSVCSNCHRKGHRAEGNKGKKDCVLDKCESYFICGQKSRHPEYSRQLAEKKKELNKLKETLGNVKEQLDMLRNFVQKNKSDKFHDGR